MEATLGNSEAGLYKSMEFLPVLLKHLFWELWTTMESPTTLRPLCCEEDQTTWRGHGGGAGGMVICLAILAEPTF